MATESGAKINQSTASEGERIANGIFVIKGPRFCSEYASPSLSPEIERKIQTILKSLKDFENLRLKRSFRYRKDWSWNSSSFFEHLYKNLLYISEYCLRYPEEDERLVDVVSIYFVECGASKFGDVDVSNEIE